MSYIVCPQDVHRISQVYVHMVSRSARVSMYNTHIAYGLHAKYMSYIVCTQDVHGTSKVYVHVVSRSARVIMYNTRIAYG